MDPYKILGVSRDASDDEIKRAYRTMAKKYHPDVNKAPGAEEKFKQIQNAYDQIMEARKRGDTSNFWEQSNGGFGGGYNSYGGSTSQKYQTIISYLNMGAYAQAYQILQSMSDRDASWYYFNAIANYGMGNQIAALDSAQRACEMDPGNQQYRQLYAQLSSSRNQYRNMQSPFGTGGSNFCCQLMLCNMCLGGCGGPLCCCI